MVYHYVINIMHIFVKLGGNYLSLYHFILYIILQFINLYYIILALYFL